MYGFSGCNEFTGSYTLEGDRLVLGMLGGTMMACEGPAMSVENLFLKSFSGALHIVIAGNDLTLTPENGGDALRFERQAPPRLEGVEWEVTGYNNGRQAVVSPKAGSHLTLMFQDGKVSGSSGCNSFHGSFTVSADADVPPAGDHSPACAAPGVRSGSGVFKALQSPTTWSITGDADVHGPMVNGCCASESGKYRPMPSIPWFR